MLCSFASIAFGSAYALGNGEIQTKNSIGTVEFDRLATGHLGVSGTLESTDRRANDGKWNYFNFRTPRRRPPGSGHRHNPDFQAQVMREAGANRVYDVSSSVTQTSRFPSLDNPHPAHYSH